MNNYWHTNFKASQGGTLPADALSFFQVDKPNVLIQALKPSEDGEGIAVRLREIGGLAGDVHLESPLLTADIIAFFATDIAENPANLFKVLPRSLYVPVKPFGIHTVVIK